MFQTVFLLKYTRAAQKVMLHILLCWPTTSETDVDGIAVKNKDIFIV